VTGPAAESNLSGARQARTDSDRGKCGQLALDSIHLALDTLLPEYGPLYARSYRTDPQIYVGRLRLDTMSETSPAASCNSMLKLPRLWRVFAIVIFRLGSRGGQRSSHD
jgi:hypothetical protein